MKKINLKKKVMLALLAGGMLCMGSALADEPDYTIKQPGGMVYDSATGGGSYSSYIQGNTTDGGLSATNYTGNEIVFRRGTYDGFVYGAYASDSNDVTNNVVTVYDGSFSSRLYGGNSEYGNVDSNTVNIFGGSFGDGFYIYGGSSGEANATNNIVNINGGSFGNGLNLYGGFVYGNTSSGNILNLKTKITGKANEVKYFQNMNFTLPSGIVSGDTMLSTGNVTYDNTTISVDAANGVKLNTGDVITLIAADSKSGDITNENATVLDGAAVLSFDSDNLIITMLQDFEQKAGGDADQQKAPVEGIAAGVAMINQCADLAMGEGMQNLLKTTNNFDTTASNYNIDTFGAVTGTRSKYKTGSHVDLDGWGFLVGVGTTKQWTHAGKTTYGIFFEYGSADFDTYNNAIHGDGESVNRGAGIMARHTLNNNTYYEGNIRYGKQKTDWSESEIGGYNTDSKYYGISAGMGHIYPVHNGNNEIDIYGRYTYGHVGGSDATVGDNEYHFDTVKSNRVRVGGKFNFNVNKGKETIKPYAGIAWEHEFSGECKASIADVGAAPTPRFKGHTGIVEAGINWEANKNMQLGIGAEACMGKRKGWSGMINMLFNF